MKDKFLMYLGALCIFGATGVVAAQITLESYDIVWWRATLGGLCLLAMCLYKGEDLRIWRHRRDMVYLLAGGFVLGGNWITLFEAYADMGVGLSIVLDYCGPAIVLLVAPWVYHDRLTTPKLISLIAAMAGVLCISSQALGDAAFSLVGLLCAVGAAVFFAGMIICNRAVRYTSGLVGATVQLLVAAALVSVYVLWQGGNPFAIASGDIWAAVVLGCVNTGLGYALYFPSARVLPVQTVAICGYIEPLSSVLLSLVVLGEVLLPLQWLGAALIVGGAVWSEWQSRHAGAMGWNLKKTRILYIFRKTY